jgi:hypothetical protein
MKRAVGLASIIVCALARPGAQTAIPSAPTLYALPFHQSPVRADPDDLLTLAGYGLVRGSTVVYRRLNPTTTDPAPPVVIPPTSTGEEGIAPAVMQRDETYMLWVLAPAGVWSNGVTINDARPLWVSPARVPRSQAIGSLPRELKVIGRNLHHAPNAMTMVRLEGPAIYEMQALDDGIDATAIERYVARVSLPPDLVPGSYQVRVSRDGQSWVAVTGQVLEVVADPPPAPPTVSLAAFRCRPNDGEDDHRCFNRAFAALPGGGVVIVPAGTWDLTESGTVDERHGLVVPVGVSLRGAGVDSTRIVRGSSWFPKALFTLVGGNTVSDIFFDDLFPDTDDRSRVSTHLQLGLRPSVDDGPSSVDDVVITRNRFERNDQAIGGGGRPVRRLIIAGNQFRAFKDALFLDNYYLPREPGAPFALSDSIVSHNLFLPGSYENPKIGQGTIASQIGASLRVDFSENVADGSASKSPEWTGRPGWRAAFFFHQANNHEELLISQNTASCTGDKAGDGEAIAYDHAVNTYAFDAPTPVMWADATRVRVPGPLLDPSPGAFVGHWIQIVDGIGVGQSRKIVSYREISSLNVEFTIDRPWEVVPFGGSEIVVTRQFWQSYIVDNDIDIRGCQKENPNWRKSGEITIWAQNSDSAIEGNVQHESDGIKIFAGHSVYEPPPAPNEPEVPRRVHFAYFLDVRSNTVLDEYNYAISDIFQNGSFSGIQMMYWTLAGRRPAQVSYGVSLAHNTVAHADSPYGGAIALNPAWFGAGSSPPDRERQLRSTIIHHNLLRDVQCSTPNCAQDPVRVAINIENDHVYDTVLYKNDVVNCRLDLNNHGINTILVR